MLWLALSVLESTRLGLILPYYCCLLLKGGALPLEREGASAEMLSS